MDNLEYLKLEYHENKKKLNRKKLYSLIDQLWESEDKLYSILRELSE